MTNELKKECGIGYFWCNTDKVCKPIEKSSSPPVGAQWAVSEEVPVNNVSGGQIAGTGVGPQGEPGVNKKKRITPFMAFVKRKQVK